MTLSIPRATALALAAALGLAAGARQAAAITINSTAPTWSHIVGGSNTSLNVTEGSGTATITEARWGDPAVGNNPANRSGLGFDPANPPASSPPINIAFLLGTLTHFNNPINAGSAATSVDLSLLTDISGATPVTQTFAYRFLVDETPNAAPCAYVTSPAGPACADRITFQNLDATSAFNVGGVNYTILLSGFSGDGGATFSTSFISNEGASNSIGLYGVVTQASVVPEPASMALLGAGLLGLAATRRQG